MGGGLAGGEDAGVGDDAKDESDVGVGIVGIGCVWRDHVSDCRITPTIKHIIQTLDHDTIITTISTITRAQYNVDTIRLPPPRCLTPIKPTVHPQALHIHTIWTKIKNHLLLISTIVSTVVASHPHLRVFGEPTQSRTTIVALDERSLDVLKEPEEFAGGRDGHCEDGGMVEIVALDLEGKGDGRRGCSEFGLLLLVDVGGFHQSRGWGWGGGSGGGWGWGSRHLCVWGVRKWEMGDGPQMGERGREEGTKSGEQKMVRWRMTAWESVGGVCGMVLQSEG